MKAKNNYAFIDSQNVNLAIREQNWILDFKRFRRYLEDKYKVSKAFIFIGFIPQNQDLYTSLQKCGYILVFKPTLQLPDGKVKGNVDAELVLHAMIEYPNYDKALIVTGDPDRNGGWGFLLFGGLSYKKWQTPEIDDTKSPQIFIVVQKTHATYRIYERA